MISLSPSQKAVIREIAQKYGARDARVFGSRAGGTFDRQSDLDIVARFDPSATLLTVIGFQQALEEALGMKVDVVEESALSPFLAERILKEAVSL